MVMLNLWIVSRVHGVGEGLELAAEDGHVLKHVLQPHLHPLALVHRVRVAHRHFEVRVANVPDVANNDSLSEKCSAPHERERLQVQAECHRTRTRRQFHPAWWWTM